MPAIVAYRARRPGEGDEEEAAFLAKAEEYAEGLQGEFVGVVVDVIDPAKDRPMLQRPIAARIRNQLGRGDHLLFDPAHGPRHLADLLKVVRYMNTRKTAVHLLLPDGEFVNLADGSEKSRATLAAIHIAVRLRYGEAAASLRGLTA